MTDQVVTPPATERRLNWSRLLRVGLLTVVLAIVANLIVYVVLAALFELPAGFASLQPGPIAFFTTLGTVGAVIAFAIVLRFSAQPVRTFTIVAAVAFLLSIVPNLLLALDPAAAPIPGGTTGGFLTLIIFHVVAALVSVGLLTRMALD